MIPRIRCICVIPPIVHTGEKLVNNLVDSGQTHREMHCRNTFLLIVCVYHTDFMVHYFCPNDKLHALFSLFRYSHFARMRGIRFLLETAMLI